jgi:hypothetical protein
MSHDNSLQYADAHLDQQWAAMRDMVGSNQDRALDLIERLEPDEGEPAFVPRDAKEARMVASFASLALLQAFKLVADVCSEESEDVA